MNCPACTRALQEHSAACPHCGLDLATCSRSLGIAPYLRADVTDLVGALTTREVHRLKQRLHELRLQFPQCTFATVLAFPPPTFPLSVYTFWLFNKGGIPAPIERGGTCRLVLLVIDVSTSRAACMVGYGLEPFLAAATLKSIVDAAHEHLENRRFFEAISASLQQLFESLKATTLNIPRIYGLHDEMPEPGQQAEEFAY